MQNPFDGFQRGLMTGSQIGGAIRQRRDRRELGGFLQSGDYTGAINAAYGQGDLETAQGLQRWQRQESDRTNGQNITGALRDGNYDQALSFAQSPEELQAITAFRDNASEQERDAAVRRAEGMVAVLTMIEGIPPEQQLMVARQRAPEFGVDPAKVTPETLTPEFRRAMMIRAIGIKDFLTSQRPISLGGDLISFPPGTDPSSFGMPMGQTPGFGGGGQPEYIDRLPAGVRPVTRPNQPVPGQPERAQPASVSFNSTEEAGQTIRRLVPGVTLTSGRRSRADNQRVRGAPNSNHLRGRAWDLTPPQGMSMAQLARTMRGHGFRVLDEGDHVHVSW